MYSKFQLAKNYLQFYRKASNSRGHGIHSPFVFQLVTKILNDHQKSPAFTAIETLRKRLLHDQTIIVVEDFGAGSAAGSANQRSISTITKNSASSPKQGQLLFRMVRVYQPKLILELGSSVGISSAYLALGNPDAKLFTIEGSSAIANIARKNFAILNLRNVELIEGNFNARLPSALRSPISGPVDFVYIDGNHRKIPTLEYFNIIMPQLADASMIVFDDIHWSREMEDAWDIIKNDVRVPLTIDLFFLGLAFFRNDFKVKQHFDIRWK